MKKPSYACPFEIIYKCRSTNFGTLDMETVGRLMESEKKDLARHNVEWLKYLLSEARKGAANMTEEIELVHPDQLRVGQKLKVVSRLGKVAHKSITVKMLLAMPSGDVEAVLNKNKNIYFSMGNYLGGTSWAQKVYILKGVL